MNYVKIIVFILLLIKFFDLITFKPQNNAEYAESRTHWIIFAILAMLFFYGKYNIILLYSLLPILLVCCVSSTASAVVLFSSMRL